MKKSAVLLVLLSFLTLASAAKNKTSSTTPTTPAKPAAPVTPIVEAPAPPLDGALEAVGAIGKSIFNRADMSPDALAKSPIMLHLTIKSTNAAATSATVTLSAEDMFSKPVALDGETQFSVPLQKGEGQKDIPFKAPGPGYFLVNAEVHAGTDTATISGDFGIVPPQHPGVRPDSIFSTTTGSAALDMDLFQAVGMKKDRIAWNASTGSLDGLAPGQVPTLDFTSLDQKLADYKSHWMWPFVCTNYTAAKGEPLALLAVATNMYGPPADYEQYANINAAVFKHYPEIKTVEMYNEPWLFGYGFAGGAADYQRFQKTFCDAVLKARPDMRIIA